MDNYPDDIGNFTCQHCKEIVPNCICDEKAYEELYEKALTGNRDDIYQDMFDSMDSDTVLDVLREFHATQSKSSTQQLVAQLDNMLEEQVKRELNK